MSRPLVRDYSFTTADHWQAGARHNFELVGDQLDVPQPRCLRLLDDLGDDLAIGGDAAIGIGIDHHRARLPVGGYVGDTTDAQKMAGRRDPTIRLIAHG